MIELFIFQDSSSFVSFTQFSPACGRMPLPALSLWPGRQPCRPRLVDGRRGGGPLSVAPRSRNPPTGRHQDSPISSSLFSQDSHMYYKLLYFVGFLSPFLLKTYVFFFTPFNKLELSRHVCRLCVGHTAELF